QLSETSPRTWWGVMRSVAGGPFERVARVRAGPSQAMSWADASPPAGVRIDYAIRRECRDVRYQGTSAAATWEPRRAQLELAMKGSNPATDRLEFEVVGAGATSLRVRLYDLLGRIAAEQQVFATGSGRDAVRLALGRGIHSGLYFLGVVSADG